MRFDPRVKASVSGILAGEDLQRALDSLLGPFDYALIWDVIPGRLSGAAEIVQSTSSSGTAREPWKRCA